jgi:hypothetical protein
MPRWVGGLGLLVAMIVLEVAECRVAHHMKQQHRFGGDAPPAATPETRPPSSKLTSIGLPEDFSTSIINAMEDVQITTDKAKRAIVDQQLKVLASAQHPAFLSQDGGVAVWRGRLRREEVVVGRIDTWSWRVG